MITSLAQAKARNAAAGLLFFDPDTVRFFGSRMPKTVIPVPNGALFVTSEQNRMPGYEPGPRLFTVRFIHDNGRTKTLGAFQAWQTRETANKVARRVAAEWTAETFFATRTNQNGGTYPVVVTHEHRNDDGQLNGVVRFFDPLDRDVAVLDGAASSLSLITRYGDQ